MKYYAPLLISLLIFTACSSEDEIELTLPNELIVSLDVAAVFNDEEFQIRYRFETENPSWYHQKWVFQDGEWVRYGSGTPGVDDFGFYEDRISMQLDDGSVPFFDVMGGYATTHTGMRSLASEASGDEVSEIDYFAENGRSDVRKFIMESREGEPDEESWKRVRSDEEIAQLRQDGVFLDLWQWRAHRSNPIGYADNGYVLEYRLNSEGTGPYTTNWDSENNQPQWMFNPEVTGAVALDFERLKNQGYGQDDHYFLYEGNAIAFDPDHEWQEGDVLPQRFLRTPDGSRGALKADGRYENGAWNVVITRTLASPNPLDSKELTPGETYHVSFAVHSGGVGARWHHVSMPLTLSLGEENSNADIVAVYTDGALDEAELDWVSLPLFYPGQTTFDWLHNYHPGHHVVRTGQVSVRDMHKLDELIEYILDIEREMEANYR